MVCFKFDNWLKGDIYLAVTEWHKPGCNCIEEMISYYYREGELSEAHQLAIWMVALAGY